MVVHLNIKDDLHKLEKVLHRHEKALIQKAAPQAVNRTLATVKSTATKELARKTGYKQKYIRPKLTLRKASAKNLVGAIYGGSARAENLIEFVAPARKTTGFFRQRLKSGKFKHQGVKAKAWGQQKTYKGTFIGSGKNSGKLLVFKRAGGGKIESVSGPSIRREFIEDELTSTLKRIAATRFRIELSAAINNQIRRQK